MRDTDNRVQLVTLYTRVLLQLVENPRVSQETLARRLDVTMRTAQRHLSELEEEGYIVVDRDSRPFRYHIDWAKTWPFMSWVRLVVLHPEVRPALQGLSEVALSAHEAAV